MPVEVDNDSGDFAIPKANAAILVSDRKDVWVCFALSNCRRWRSASLVFPTVHDLALLQIPAENFFIRGDNCLPCASAIAILARPEDVRGARGNYTKGFGMFVLPV
jgi:hypothetical protein